MIISKTSISHEVIYLSINSPVVQQFTTPKSDIKSDYPKCITA